MYIRMYIYVQFYSFFKIARSNNVMARKIIHYFIVLQNAGLKLFPELHTYITAHKSRSGIRTRKHKVQTYVFHESLLKSRWQWYQLS